MNTPPIWHLRAQQRAKARQDAAHDHLSTFITTGQPTPYGPYRFADLPYDACYGYYGHNGRYCDTPWQPAPWRDDPARFVPSARVA